MQVPVYLDTVNIQVLIHTEDGISRRRAEGVGLVWIDLIGELDEKLRRDMGWDGIGEIVGRPAAVCQVGTIAGPSPRGAPGWRSRSRCGFSSLFLSPSRR